MLLANNGRASSSKQTRHMNIRYFFVTDRIQTGDIRVAYCPTDDMIADFFTKPLQGSKFTRFRDQILNVQSEPDVTTTSAQRSVLGNDVQADDPDRIPSTTPGAEPPRDARDSGSARSHSTHLETSSSDRPKWSPTRSSTRYQDQISVKCTRRTLRMPSFTRAAHAQPSLSNFPRRDSNFGERTHSRGTTLGERNFPTSPQNKITKLTHCSIYVPMRTISTPQTK